MSADHPHATLPSCANCGYTSVAWVCVDCDEVGIPVAPTDELERLRVALREIKAYAGRVCSTFEICTHPACQSSYAAWAIADKALRESGGVAA